jgi:hypothetical protein
MKKTILFFFLIFTFSLLVISCHCKRKAVYGDKTTSEEKGGLQGEKRDFIKEGYQKATVINYTVDGCTFLLELEDNRKLEPVNLAADFKKDKLEVWIKFIAKKDGVSACMAGSMVELSDIRLRK